MCAHEWAETVAGFIPKKLSALIMTEFGRLSASARNFSLFLKIVVERMDHAMEDNGLFEYTGGIQLRSEY